MQQSNQVKSVPLEPKPADIPVAQRIAELRAISLSVLAFGTGGVNLWRCFAELKKIKPTPALRAAYLEARIGIAIAQRIRPSATVRAINDLRKLRTAQGEPERFKAFEALFMRSLGNIRLSNHAYQQASFADLDHGPVWSTVGRHIGALNAKNYEVFLNSGTLLGVVRDQRLIDHDDDIDLCVVLNATSLNEAVLEWKALTAEIHAEGLIDLASFGDPTIIKLLPIDQVQVDLFPCWIEGEKVFIYPHTHGDLEVEDVLPLKTCSVTGNPIPADPEKMLCVNYGEGWRKPDPYFKFPWTKARRKFASFIEGLS